MRMILAKRLNMFSTFLLFWEGESSFILHLFSYFLVQIFEDGGDVIVMKKTLVFFKYIYNTSI